MPRKRRSSATAPLAFTVAPGITPNSARPLGRKTVKLGKLTSRGPMCLRLGATLFVEISVSALKEHRSKCTAEIEGFLPTKAAVFWTDRNGYISARVRPLGRLLSKAKPRYVKQADFILLNFFNTWDRTVHRIGDCELVLEPHRHINDVTKRLGIEGGYAITHAGRVCRIDGNSMSLRSARHLLDAIGWYLTFARGAHVHPMFIEAPSTTTSAVFRDWTTHRSTGWQATDTWFDPFWSLNLFDEAFPGFLAAYEKHGKPLLIAIDWYLHAHAAEVMDAKIIFAVSAIEILAVLAAVGSFEPAAVAAFDKAYRSAAAKIGALLTRMHGSAEVPSPLCRLRRSCAAAGIDAPTIVTRLRNVVHANQIPHVLKHTHAVRSEAAELAFFWFEAALLHICGVPISRITGRNPPTMGRWSRWTRSRLSSRG